jgi:Zn-dependent M32 family carboxypeptidase
MEKSDPVKRVLEKAVNCEEREAVGEYAGVRVRLEKKVYPKRHGGTGWKVEAKNYDGSVRELESGLSAGKADRMFERLRDQYYLEEKGKDD